MLVIDLNSVGFAATAANAELSANGVRTGGVFGTLRTMRMLREEHAGPMIGLWDGRSWRYDDFPDYKGNRKVDPKLVAIKERWKAQKPMVTRALRAMGVTQIFSLNMEADDLAARLVKQQTGRTMTLVTGDKDWLQLVNEHVSWLDPIHRPQLDPTKPARIQRCTPDNFEALTGFKTTWQFVQCKALKGDVGDNIPPAGGVGEGAAKWIFDHVGGVDALFNESLDRAALKWPKKIIDFVDSEEKVANYRRNLKLVWLSHPEVPAAQKPTISKGPVDVDRFTALAEELNFHSILREPEAWLAPFNHS